MPTPTPVYEEIFELIVKLMETYERSKDLTGAQKKAKVLEKVQAMVIEHIKMSDDEKQAFLFFMENIAPTIIDGLVQISKRRMEINVAVKKFCCGGSKN